MSASLTFVARDCGFFILVSAERGLTEARFIWGAQKHVAGSQALVRN